MITEDFLKSDFKITQLRARMERLEEENALLKQVEENLTTLHNIALAEIVEAKAYHEAYREEMIDGCAVMQVKFDTLKDQVKVLREALKNVEQEHHLLAIQRNAVLNRKSSFGIATADDQWAKEYQAVEPQLNQLVDARREALATTEKGE